LNSFTHLAGLWSDPRRRACWATRATIAILALGVAGWSLVKDFDKDEIEAVHSAWKMLHGERIYVDFFQHHHPLLYAYLTPVIALCGERPATLLACRVAMWPFLAGMLAATYILGRRVFGRPAATIGVLLALASWPLMVKAVEIRPDVPQVLCGMIALVLLFPRTRQAARRSALRTGAEACVADHVYMVPGSAKERDFRGAKGDNPAVIDSPVLSTDIKVILPSPWQSATSNSQQTACRRTAASRPCVAGGRPGGPPNAAKCPQAPRRC
jgi:hypothetical protein